MCIHVYLICVLISLVWPWFDLVWECGFFWLGLSVRVWFGYALVLLTPHCMLGWSS